MRKDPGVWGIQSPAVDSFVCRHSRPHVSETSHDRVHYEVSPPYSSLRLSPRCFFFPSWPQGPKYSGHIFHFSKYQLLFYSLFEAVSNKSCVWS